jgi:hypothetical protein
MSGGEGTAGDDPGPGRAYPRCVRLGVVIYLHQPLPKWRTARVLVSLTAMHIRVCPSRAQHSHSQDH